MLLPLLGATTVCVAFFSSVVDPLLFTFCASFLIFSSSVSCGCILSEANGSTIFGSNPFVLIGTPFTVNVATRLEADDVVVEVLAVCLVFEDVVVSVAAVVAPSGSKLKLDILATNLSSPSILYRNSTIFEYSPTTLKFKSHNLKSVLLASSSLEVPFDMSNLNFTPLSVA